MTYFKFINKITLNKKSIDVSFSAEPINSKYVYKQIKDTRYLIIDKIYSTYNIKGVFPLCLLDVLDYINNKISYLKSVQYTQVLNDYLDYKQIEPSSLNSIDKVKKLYLDNNPDQRPCYRDFCYYLFEYGFKSILKSKPEHYFVIPKTKELKDEEFGKRGEQALFRYLKKNYEGNNWYKGVLWPRHLLPTCQVEWENESSESYRPCDISITFDREIVFEIEVKSTRGTEDIIFFLSIAELQEALVYPGEYIVARVSFIEEEKPYQGIRLNDEFYVNYYRFKPSTIKIIEDKIEEWKDYYKENRIRFTIEHFDKVNQESIEEITFFDIANELNEEYQPEFREFINETYFKEILNVISVYKEVELIAEKQTTLNYLMNEDKFKTLRFAILIPA